MAAAAAFLAFFRRAPLFLRAAALAVLCARAFLRAAMSFFMGPAALLAAAWLSPPLLLSAAAALVNLAKTLVEAADLFAATVKSSAA